MGADRTSTRPTRIAAAVGHLAVAIAVTAPLAWRANRLPLGTEATATVPQFNLWTLEWTAQRLPHGLSGWWDAPIFWPQRGAFAFSEPQPLTGLAFALARPLLGSVAAYSWLLILTIALNGLAGAALARRLGAGAVPAFLAGVLAQTLPFVFAEFGVLQLVAVWPLLAATACLVAWLAEPRLRQAALLGLALAAAVGTCGYYALLFTLCLAVAAPVAIDRTWARDWRARVSGIALAAGVMLAIAGPFALGQHHRLSGRRWLDETILGGSATWQDWAPAGPYWPGAALLALGTAGLAIGWRRRAARVLATIGLAAFVFSLGSELSVLGLRPWVFLTDHVDAFARLRSPFRAAAVTQLMLVGLSAVALHWLWTRRAVPVRAAAPLLVVAALLTSGFGPGHLASGPPKPGAWATWLIAHPDGQPVAFMPFAPTGAVADFQPTTTRMLQSIDTGHPMVNGYSGFFPADHRELAQALATFPDNRSVAELQARRVRYVVVDARTWSNFKQRVAEVLGIKVLAHDRDGYLLRVPTTG